MKKKENIFVSKPFFIGGICLIVSLFLAMVANSLSALFPFAYVNQIYAIVGFLISLPIYYAFFLLGKGYNNSLLKILSIIAVIFSFLFILGSNIVNWESTNYFSEFNQTIFEANKSIYELNSSGNLTLEQAVALNQEIEGKITEAVLPLFIIGVVFGILFLIYSIFFGVALIKLDKKVKYAKVAGILTIVGACTLIIFVGIFVLLAALIFEIIILFDQAKKFKEY